MPVYQVIEDRVNLKEVRTVSDFVDLISLADVDLDELEADMIQVNQEEVPIIHHFAPGIYIREARFNAGDFVIGHKHRCPHLNVMLDGKLTMANGLEVTAPTMFVGGPTRKAAVMHTDCVWLNIYATDEQDVGKIENMFMEKSATAIAQECDMVSLTNCEVLDSISDFDKMLDDIGLSRDQVESLSACQEDRVPLPWGAYKFRSAMSPIHGNGVFASAKIKAGETIGPANIAGCRTVLWYGVNHSGNPNAKMVMRGHGLDLIATRDISGNRGGRLGDEITVDYRESRREALCLVRSLRR